MAPLTGSITCERHWWASNEVLSRRAAHGAAGGAACLGPADSPRGFAACASHSIAATSPSSNTQLSKCGPSVILMNIGTQEAFYNVGQTAATVASAGTYSLPGGDFILLLKGPSLKGEGDIWIPTRAIRVHEQRLRKDLTCAERRELSASLWICRKARPEIRSATLKHDRSRDLWLAREPCRRRPRRRPWRGTECRFLAMCDRCSDNWRHYVPQIRGQHRRGGHASAADHRALCEDCVAELMLEAVISLEDTPTTRDYVETKQRAAEASKAYADREGSARNATN